MTATRDDILPLTETVAPATAEELSATVARAARDEVAIYPIGGATSLGYGAIPTRPGIGLQTVGLARVIDYPARDMTITVEAGIPMARLAALLAEEGQRLPIDCPRPEEATLGGVIATNASGPRRFGQGRMRDYVIGISAVDGRGVAFKGGGRVVKNVAGYDFCKLLTGSLGTLAVVTQVTLKVRPVVEASSLVVCPLTDAAQAERVLNGLVNSRTTPTAIEWLAGPAWDEPAVAGAPQGGAGYLVLGFEGTHVEVDWQIGEIGRELNAAGVNSVQAVQHDVAGSLWRRLTDFEDHPAGALTVKFSVLPSKLVELVGAVRGRDPQCSIQAHAGNGIVLVQFATGPSRADDRGWWEQFLWATAARAGGQVVVVRSSRREWATVECVWGPPDGSRRLMRSIKQQFDPRGILNPDRFVY